ncbi:MAG TPA: flagellar basal body-associated FliL family protein [Planctomycetota bacterium]|nr:flagellar basal body-associated FliL family protein [Planctomycetota bacterium]
MLIAARHAKVKFARFEEDRLRDALTTALLAREPLMDALAALPGGFSEAEREALVLDLLDYQAEPAKSPTTPAPANDPPAGGAAPASPPGANAAVTPATNDKGPLLIRLPQLTLSRSLPGVGKRTLSLTIALFFRDPLLAQKLQDRAPLVQDAILSYVQALPPAQFAEPNQLTLKDGITAAIIAKVPEFPPDAVLIPELTSGSSDGTEPAKPAH